MAAKMKSKRRAKKSARKRAPKAARKTKSAKRPVRKSREPSWRREFTSLSDVRAAIDGIDARIVPLLCQRLYFVTQAAQFKPSVKGVIVQSRVEEVVEHARRLAEAAGGAPDTIEVVYRAVIDAFTADEQRRWRELNRRS